VEKMGAQLVNVHGTVDFLRHQGSKIDSIQELWKASEILRGLFAMAVFWVIFKQWRGRMPMWLRSRGQ
jgi:hypothetical protein